MSQSGGVLTYLVLFVILFVIVIAIMLVSFSRTRRRTNGNAPAVGTERDNSDNTPQRLQYRPDNDPMDDDVGGNLRKVPNQQDNSRREPPR